MTVIYMTTIRNRYTFVEVETELPFIYPYLFIYPTDQQLQDQLQRR